MVDRTKKIPAHFYRNDTSGEPIRDWLKGLSLADRRTIVKDIQKVEFGWPIGLPVCRPLGQGVWAVRSDLTSGRIARVLFCITQGQMVLLHGFIKKTQQTPKRDLDLALRRQRDMES